MIKVKDDDIVEIDSPGEDSGESEEILDEFENLGDVEGGIFDEDFEDVDEEEPSSDFDIGTTLLSVSAPVESWQGQNLEEKISRERVEKDWNEERDFVGSDIYNASSGGSGVYGTGSDAYFTGRGEGVYGTSGSGVYDSGKKGEGSYSVPAGNSGNLKTHDQVRDERRGGSMLESLGFEDKKKRDHDKFTRDFVALGDSDAGS